MQHSSWYSSKSSARMVKMENNNDSSDIEFLGTSTPSLDKANQRVAELEAELQMTRKKLALFQRREAAATTTPKPIIQKKKGILKKTPSAEVKKFVRRRDTGDKIGCSSSTSATTTLPMFFDGDDGGIDDDDKNGMRRLVGTAAASHSLLLHHQNRAAAAVAHHHHHLSPSCASSSSATAVHHLPVNLHHFNRHFAAVVHHSQSTASPPPPNPVVVNCRFLSSSSPLSKAGPPPPSTTTNIITMPTGTKTTTTTTAPHQWAMGERIRCFSQSVEYAAKIVDKWKGINGHIFYKIHYIGWTKRMDETVGEAEAAERFRAWDSSELEPGMFNVDRLCGERVNKQRLEYLVHWEGFDHSEDTWEPANRLIADGCGWAIDAYEQKVNRNKDDYQWRKNK